MLSVNYPTIHLNNFPLYRPLLQRWEKKHLILSICYSEESHRTPLPGNMFQQKSVITAFLLPPSSCLAHRTFLEMPQFSSVAQSCPTLCDPMNCSTQGLPVHHHLPEFTQTHGHRVGDAIQPSHPLHPLLLLPPIPPSIRAFSNESTLRMRWPKYWSFSFSIFPSKEHPGLISLQSKGLSRAFSNTGVYK